MRPSLAPDHVTTPVPPRLPLISSPVPQVFLARPASFAGRLEAIWTLAEPWLGRQAVRLAALAGLIAAQVALLLSPEAGIPSALASGARFGLGAWVVLSLLAAGEAVLRASLRADTVAPNPALSWRGALGVVVVACLAAVAFALGSPGRLVAGSVCFILLSVALAWTVGRAAGGGAAARAVAALGVFAAVAAGTDLPSAPRLAEAGAGSSYRWSTGWPAEDWVLRHEVRPDPPLPPQALLLKIALAAPYDGPSRVYAALNGHQLGPGRLDGRTTLEYDVPADLVAGRDRLVLDLRQTPPDPRLRIVAQRWGQAATAGPGASSHFDGVRWWPGTFDDAVGRRQPGIYILELDPAP